MSHADAMVEDSRASSGEANLRGQSELHGLAGYYDRGQNDRRAGTRPQSGEARSQTSDREAEDQVRWGAGHSRLPQHPGTMQALAGSRLSDA